MIQINPNAAPEIGPPKFRKPASSEQNSRHEDCTCDLTKSYLPSIPQKGELDLSKSPEVIQETPSSELTPGKDLLWRISASSTAITSGLSVYVGSLSLILMKQIERAHCLECWLTKVLPASVLLGFGGYLLSRFDRKKTAPAPDEAQHEHAHSEEVLDKE